MRNPRSAYLFVGGVAAVVAATLAGACKSDDPVDPAGSCADLASRCHPYDKVSAIGHECHELGHAGNDSACAPRKAECLAACPETEAGTQHPKDAGPSADPDAGEGGTPDAGDLCTPYCTCLTDTCSSLGGYPFTGTPDCVAKCPMLSSEEKSCLPKWCEQAKTLANKTHVCEHAWGKFGLDECETL